MAYDSTIDPATGLLHRTAFLQEVRNGQSKVRSRGRRGCLLILYFPMLQSIVEQGGSDAATQTLRNLLAVVETRLRSRDTLGRIGEHSLCVLLRQCVEKHAVIIAEQYVALLRDVIIDAGSQIAPVELRYRIVPLDSLGRRPRQGVSRWVREPVLPDAVNQTSQSVVSTEGPEHVPSKVVSINTVRDRQNDLNLSMAGKPASNAGPRTDTTLQSVNEQKTKQINSTWRLKPGLLLSGKPLVCCYRAQRVGASQDLALVQSNSVFMAVLKALALKDNATRPVIESQLIMPIQASQLNSDLPVWLKHRCAAMRVAPSDVCFSLTVESLSKNLRATVPILRLLNRQGIRLMLEGATSRSQFRGLQNLAVFDYLYLSASALQGSLRHISQRQELEELIAEAQSQNSEICAAGVDSNALLVHARKLGVDIGFGRECAKSLPFPEALDLQK